MLPGEIFTSFAEFQGIVSTNDFRIPVGLQELLQAPLCFLRSFCFARIRLDPLGGQVLHHDCISMIVSRFTTFTENFEICCNQITKIFCTRYGSANASSARNPCNLGPLSSMESNGITGPINSSPNRLSYCVYPSVRKVLYKSQIAVTFHRITIFFI